MRLSSLVALASSLVWIACAGGPGPAGPRPGDDGGSAPSDAGCAAGTRACDGQCVDTTSSFAHCGGCGNACAPGEVCSGSACLTGGCPAPTMECSGSCVDTSSSEAHCGGCDRLCPSGSTCESGSCACAGGLEVCGDACTDTQTSSAHCGGCDRPCAAGQACEVGACVACGSGISFATDVQPIFTATCTGAACHAGMRPASDLDLQAGRAYAELVGVSSTCTDRRLLVDPGNAAESALYQKVSGIGICSGNRMPLGGRPLSDADVATIEGWICGGARND